MELAEYTPYGSLNRREGLVDSTHKFTGQRFDGSTGLYFYNSRYYDPQLGRFIQADPIVPSPGDPQALNRYSYVRNNPLKYTDPSGHFFWLIGLLVGLLISIAVEITISFLNIDGFGANALRFAGAIVSGGVGGSIGGLTGQALANTIAAAGATSLTMNTGEGRQLMRSISKQFMSWGMSPKAATIIGSALTSTAMSASYGALFSGVTAPPGLTRREISPQEYLTSEKYAELRAGGGESGGGFFKQGSNISDTAGALGARVYEFSRQGRPLGILATAPLFRNVPILGRLTSFLRVNHSAFVGYKSTGGMVNSMIPIAGGEYASVAVCHTCTLNAASIAGVSALSTLTAIGPSSVPSTLLYGLHGGSAVFYAGTKAVDEELP